ncbi:MAG TPA: protease inhibitor I42 family protein [Negativicutes bacterium]|nr:protease inhibitor I42 family protein [Negativicutes bacterium]
MKTIRILVVMMLTLAMLTVGVASAAEKKIDDYPVATTVEVVGANGETKAETINVTPGDYFMVVLYAAGGTGYSWTLDSKNLTLTEVIADSTEPVSSQPLAGGSVRWKFCLRVKPEMVGQETLHFNLSRPWMKDAKPAQAFNLTVVTK